MQRKYLKYSRSVLLCLLFLVIVIVLPVISTGIMNRRLGMDITGWIQAFVAVISFPIILFELDQIRQAINRKPELEVGLVNIRDLPFSQVRLKHTLPKAVKVSSGYAHFYVVLRNNGNGPARHVKIYIEHINRTQDVVPRPHIKVSEFSEEKPTFVHEHNFDFVFRAGSDWIINPDDLEPFGFHITTSLVEGKTRDGVEIRKSPPPCEVILDCTVWAEGLDQPKQERFSVQIVEHLART